MDTVHVYDTWVNGKNGRLHFDVMTMKRPGPHARQAVSGGNRGTERGHHAEGVSILP